MIRQMRSVLLLMILVVIALGGYCFAAGGSKTYDVKATVPAVAGAWTQTLSRVHQPITPAGGCAPTTSADWVTASSIDFGTLQPDPVNHIFLPSDPHFYVVDLAVTDNVSVGWDITHTRTNMTNLADASKNLNGNVNVVFKKIIATPTPADRNHTTEEDLTGGKLSYEASNGKKVADTELLVNGQQGWLRVYYGIGTGDPGDKGCATDATGVSPVGLNTKAGTYQGQVTFTLVTH